MQHPHRHNTTHKLLYTPSRTRSIHAACDRWSDDLGRTIAHLVCEVVSVQSPPLIKVLITRNADFAKKDNAGMTPLHWVRIYTHVTHIHTHTRRAHRSRRT